jgi:hypothetical protein
MCTPSPLPLAPQHQTLTLAPQHRTLTLTPQLKPSPLLLKASTSKPHLRPKCTPSTATCVPSTPTHMTLISTCTCTLLSHIHSLSLIASPSLASNARWRWNLFFSGSHSSLELLPQLSSPPPPSQGEWEGSLSRWVLLRYVTTIPNILPLLTTSSCHRCQCPMPNLLSCPLPISSSMTLTRMCSTPTCVPSTHACPFETMCAPSMSTLVLLSPGPPPLQTPRGSSDSSHATAT